MPKDQTASSSDEMLVTVPSACQAFRHAYPRHQRGQVSIPAAVRRRLGISASTRLEWVVGDATGVEWVSCEPEILRAAARIKARSGLSVADAWIAATAVVRDAVLVHKDPEFRHARDVRQERLGT